jgi:hypothetical protein
MKKQTLNFLFCVAILAATPVVAMEGEESFAFRAPKKQKQNNDERVNNNPSLANDGLLFSNPASTYTLSLAQLQALRGLDSSTNTDASISYQFKINNKNYTLTYLSPNELAAYEKKPGGWFKLSDNLGAYNNIGLPFVPEKLSPNGPTIFRCKASIMVPRNQKGGYSISLSQKISLYQTDGRLLQAAYDLYKEAILCHYTVTEIQ